LSDFFSDISVGKREKYAFEGLFKKNNLKFMAIIKTVALDNLFFQTISYLFFYLIIHYEIGFVLIMILIKEILS